VPVPPRELLQQSRLPDACFSADGDETSLLSGLHKRLFQRGQRFIPLEKRAHRSGLTVCYFWVRHIFKMGVTYRCEGAMTRLDFHYPRENLFPYCVTVINLR
jgi:hypothetical protein